MPNNKHNIPKELRLGKGKASREAKPPGTMETPNNINTNFQEIKWTRSKLTITVVLLSIPYLIALIGSFVVGNILVGLIFLGIGAFTVGIYLLLRYIERADF